MKQSRSSAVGAYEMLLEAIERGALAAGARLREAELAMRFGISRTPIREALKRLEMQGLVLHEPHHGAVIARLDYSQMAELYLMREVLEGTAARLAAIHASSTEVQVLQEMVQADRALIGAPQELATRNRSFHRQMRLCGRNRFLNEMLENMRLSLVLLAGTTLAVPRRGLQSIEEHEAIVTAIAQHDADEAEARAREHIRNAFHARISLISAARRD